MVRKGDTLSKLGRDYGVSFSEIAYLNGIRDEDDLEVGDRLLIAYASDRGLDQNKRYFSFSESRRDVPSSLHRLDKGEEHKLLWPVKGVHKVVSGFGPRGNSFHDGIDIAAPRGTKVLAAHGGDVVYASSGLKGYGRLVIIKSSSGLSTVYAHNSRLRVRKGDKVKRGQVIAEVGSTGKSTGNHLHFEIRIKNKNGSSIALDPLPALGYASGASRYRINDNLRAILVKTK